MRTYLNLHNAGTRQVYQRESILILDGQSCLFVQKSQRMTAIGPDQKSPNLENQPPAYSAHGETSSHFASPNPVNASTPAASSYPILVSTGARLESSTMHSGVWILEPIYEPLRIWCPADQAYQTTQVQKRPGTSDQKAYILDIGFWACCMSALLCSTCCWPCFFIPFCHPFCMDSVHRCTHCGRVLAVIPP